MLTPVESVNQSVNRNLELKQPSAGAMIFKQIGIFLLDLIKIVVICAVIIIPVRLFLIQPFYVKGASMEPNFHNGEYLIIYQLPYQIKKITHNFNEEDRGFALVLHPPDNEKDFYIKRLIALPGEGIEIKNGKIYIYNINHPDGFILDESHYLLPEIHTNAGNQTKIELKQTEVFVLGDNRSASLDSRKLGPIPIKNIIGQAIFRGWPLDKVGIISKPKYIP